ncbi:MAG: transcriptional regulator [Deltaproteobacteria bacterium]|nr:transcriptional regulator [Deltaproteobacteria bacterium]
MTPRDGFSAEVKPVEESRGWSFGPFELLPGRGLVRDDGVDVEIAAKPLAVLQHLVRHRERVVSRRELLEAIWPGVSVSDSALTSVLRDLRRALGESGDEIRFVATYRGRGLRFRAPVRAVQVQSGASEWQEAARHFERALRALDLVSASRGQATGNEPHRELRERGDLLVALARARWAGGSTDSARSAFLYAARVGRRTGDGQILAEAALGYAGRTDVTPGVNREAVSLLEEALASLPDGDSALRAELLARLGTESYYEVDPRRSDDLTREAMAMAERIPDKGVLGYAITARHFVLQRPEVSPRERLALGERVLSLFADEPPSDVLALALQECLVDQLELGDGDAFDHTFQHYQQVVAALEQPFFLWLESVFAGMRTLLAGRVDEAERAAHASFELGQRIGSPNASLALAGQLFGIRREQDRLAELLPIMDEMAADDGGLPVFRAGRAAVLAAAGPPERARAALDAALADELDDFPRDQNWLATLGTLAPAVAAFGRASQIELLVGQLAPYADRVIVVGQGVTTHGAVSHHLGLLTAALGAVEAADRHFDHAEAVHAQLRAPLWLARTRRARDLRTDGQIPG